MGDDLQLRDVCCKFHVMLPRAFKILPDYHVTDQTLCAFQFPLDRSRISDTSPIVTSRYSRVSAWFVVSGGHTKCTQSGRRPFGTRRCI